MANLIVSNGVLHYSVVVQIVRRGNFMVDVVIRGRAPEFGSSEVLPWETTAELVAKYSHFKVMPSLFKKIRELFPDLERGFRIRVLNPD